MTFTPLTKNQAAELLEKHERTIRRIADEKGWNREANEKGETVFYIPNTYLEEEGLTPDKLVSEGGQNCPGGVDMSMDKTSITPETVGTPEQNTTHHIVRGGGHAPRKQPVDFQALYDEYINLELRCVSAESDAKAQKFAADLQAQRVRDLEKQVDLLKTIINDKSRSLQRLEFLEDQFLDEVRSKRKVEYFAENRESLSDMIATMANASIGSVRYDMQAVQLYHLAKWVEPQVFETYRIADVDGLIDLITLCREEGYKFKADATPEAVAFIRSVAHQQKQEMTY